MEPLASDSNGQFLAELRRRSCAHLSPSTGNWSSCTGTSVAIFSSDRSAKKWGAKVIDRLPTDLMERSFPDMKRLSPRNLKYMRAFAEAWPEEPFVQAVLAQITWYHNVAILEKLAWSADRIW